MAKAGRKGWKEELEMGRRYSDLSEKAFAVLSEMMDSDDKADRKWAVQELNKGLVKMIPQSMELAGKEGAPALTVKIIGKD